jgi:hypothetical protein
MIGWLKTAQGMLATFATPLAIIATWWNLGLARLEFSDELAPVPAGPSSAARRQLHHRYSGGFSWYSLRA